MTKPPLLLPRRPRPVRPAVAIGRGALGGVAFLRRTGNGMMLARDAAMPDPSPAVTRILQRAAQGDPTAATELLPLVYEQLRKLADARLRREGGRHGASPTLQATALVHEAWLRLCGDGDSHWNSRAHFFGAAALAMRRILVDRARARQAEKRGGGVRLVDIDVESFGCEPDPDLLLAIDEALTRLAIEDPALAELVQLRWLCGLTVDEVAAALGATPAQTKARWLFGRAWLHHALRQFAPGPDTPERP